MLPGTPHPERRASNAPRAGTGPTLATTTRRRAHPAHTDPVTPPFPIGTPGPNEAYALNSTSPTSTTMHRLFLWDTPNMDMSLHRICGGKPAQRPQFDAISDWLLARTPAATTIDAIVVVAIPEGRESRMAPWITALRSIGWNVHASPRSAGDIDDHVVAHAAAAAINHPDGGELIIASHDQELVDRCNATAPNHTITVVGYTEFSHWTQTADVAFIDLESIDGAFTTPLPRSNLADLPAEGILLPAFADLVPTSAVIDDVAALIDTLIADNDDNPVLFSTIGSACRANIPRFGALAHRHGKVSDVIATAANTTSRWTVVEQGPGVSAAARTDNPDAAP